MIWDQASTEDSERRNAKGESEIRDEYSEWPMMGFSRIDSLLKDVKTVLGDTGDRVKAALQTSPIAR